jgi:hypothetical protein
VYDVTVQVSDGTLSDTQAIAVTVTDVVETVNNTYTFGLSDGAQSVLDTNGGTDALGHDPTASARSLESAAAARVELLRAAGGTGGGATARLFNAVSAQDLDGVRAAIADGADVNSVSPPGATPLTPAPIASTTPAPSAPSTCGNVRSIPGIPPSTQRSR